jgi:hypothetical protein
MSPTSLAEAVRKYPPRTGFSLEYSHFSHGLAIAASDPGKENDINSTRITPPTSPNLIRCLIFIDIRTSFFNVITPFILDLDSLLASL